MADNTKIWPIFRSANWGLSDDLFTGIKNSFYYSNDMEIREDAKSIYPKQAPRQWAKYDLWARNVVWYCQASRYFNWHWYVFTEKDVFKIDTENEVATSLWVSSWISTEWIHDAELFNWYVYFSTWSHLYRISQSAADANWASAGNFTVMNLNSSSYHPLYATDIMMVVGNGKEVSKVTKEVPDQVQAWITLQDDYQVKFLNELWWFIRVIAEDWYYWAELLLWDKVSSAADEIIPMNWYKFLQSRIYNWYHYLLSNRWLWLINWYQFYILKRMEELASYDRKENWMIVYDDKLYFVKSDWIYIYWAKNKNYNDVLNLWSARDDGWVPWALATDWHTIVYSEANKSWGVNTSHTYVYLRAPYTDDVSLYRWQNWELQTMAYFGSSMSEIKQAMYLRVWYYIYSWYIKVYYRTEADVTSEDPDDWNWHELTQDWWLWPNSDMRAPFATSLKLNCRFQWIQFKFELNQSRTQSQPRTNLYSADLYYNDMLD